MSEQYSEIVNLNYVVRMSLNDSVTVNVYFVDGECQYYILDTPEQAQELMKQFEGLCVFGCSQVTPAFVIYQEATNES